MRGNIMSETLTLLSEESKEQLAMLGVAPEIGKVSIFSLLAEESQNVTPGMTWQSAWGNREDR